MKELERNNNSIVEHKRILAQYTPESWTKLNSAFGNRYIPLENVEAMLDELYTHHEVVIPFPPQYIDGQVLTTVNLIVHHPVTGAKLTYSGQSCVTFNSVSHKSNHKNIPAGESFAMMNASRKIGNIFNPERVDSVENFIHESEEVDEEVVRMVELIKRCNSKVKLGMFLSKVKELDNKEVSNFYKQKMLVI